MAPAPVYRSVDRYFQFALLGLVASGFFALAGTGRLDAATIIFTTVTLLVRAGVLAGWLRFVIPHRAVILAAIGYVLFYPVDFFWISRDFFTATIHGVCFLAGVKILTGRSDRDLPYTGLVAFVQLVAAALLSWQAGFLVWLALSLLFAVAVFTSGEIRKALRPERQIAPVSPGLPLRLAGVALLALIAIIALSGAFFIMVPRTARAAAVLFPGASRLTGFSGVVDLGNFGAIGKDDRAVAHVLSYSRPLPPDMKWRGTTLSRFDGRRWFEPTPMTPLVVPIVNGQAEVAGRAQRSRLDGRRLLYRVDSAAASNGTLFIAGIPEYINLLGQPGRQRLVRRAGNTWQALPATNEVLRYEVSALLAQPLAEALSQRERVRYSSLPVIDARIWPLAREWAGEGTPLDRALRIQGHLRREFSYTLDAPARRGPDPLARFLFVDRRGYCEYFASAMAVMLRSIGIPSRVVTGFQSGYFNRVSGMTVIRASDAHAWVEGWVDSLGWVTFDPTPASFASESGIMGRLNMYLDAADSVWQQWIVAYDLGRQATLAARVQAFLRSGRPAPGGGPEFRPGALAREHWILLTAFLTGLLVLWNLGRIWNAVRNFVWLRRLSSGPVSSHDAARLYQLMLRRVGISKPADVTPAAFALLVPEAKRQQVANFTRLYNEARYGGKPESVARLAAMLRHWA